jgi:hypothetical protein
MGPFTKKVGEPYQKSGYVYWLPLSYVVSRTNRDKDEMV